MVKGTSNSGKDFTAFHHACWLTICCRCFGSDESVRIATNIKE